MRLVWWRLVLPLSLVLPYWVTVRTRVMVPDTAAPSPGGLAPLPVYGFPFPYTHFGGSSSGEYAFYVLPLLLNWALTLATLSLGAFLTRHALAQRRWRGLGALLWCAAVFTLVLLGVRMGIGRVSWQPSLPMVEVSERALWLGPSD
ncbi:hypothetical protein [Deinococcus arcticus]|uniref:Uncharacterized protein n=1 Tax=Deinococcus arcticus TaxID=2136176 RepID=A0A2T3W623_9DEIO|nr:hypothetical protein [Deinococcus arcticus]PTA67341.1 hypothetical protein C8263_13685 [Deinococcus arcticus]